MLIIIGLIVSFFIIYFLVTLVLSYIAVNKNFSECDKDGVEVYIMTNGVHTDIVVPLKNEIKDWTELVNPSVAKQDQSLAKYVAFGWGDKGFYLETPTWAELKASTAFKAMFFLSSTAMHITFYDELYEGEKCKKVFISKDQYKKLVVYIDKSFQKQDGQSVLIPDASYGDNDIFYDAIGNYSMFYTCNSWANEGIKAAGMKASLWTLFDKGIFYHYKD